MFFSSPKTISLYRLLSHPKPNPRSSELLKYRIGCSAENDTSWVLALPENDANQVAKVSQKRGTGSSHVLELPVMKYDRRENEGMKEVLSRGFMLSWIASDCTFCKSTGGKCGFDYPSYHFKSFFALIGPTAPAGKKENLDFKAGLATTVAGIGLFLIVILYYLRKKPFTNGSLEKFIFDEKNAAESSHRLNSAF